MEALDDILLDAEAKMEKSVSFLHDEFAGVRTGKANASFVANVSVSYYGTPTRLREIAGIATPEPRLIVINSYDPTALAAIEKGILAANLGVTPMNDGRVIRIVMPELSEERRRELTKVIKRMSEDSRIAIRNVRRDTNELVKDLQKKGKISEDEKDSALAEIQKNTDAYIKKVDDLLAAKEKDIMAV